jgi:hypothetical protein
VKTVHLYIYPLVRRLLVITLLLVLGPWTITAASAQTIAQDVVIDNRVPVGEPLEKAIDYFTSQAFPSVIVGNGRGGLYLYRSITGQLQGPWRRSVIVERGSAYERARPIKFNGDAYPGLVASIGNQIVLFENPGNRGHTAAITRPWPAHVVNPNHGCHDIRLEDLDGDGKVDIVCSGAISLRAPEFVAFQNDRNHWQVIDDVADVGDDVAILRVGNDTLPHLVGSDPSGNIFWYENPRARGGNARSAHWSKHFIGPGNVGNSFAAGQLVSGKYAVVTAANEHEGPGGGTDDRGITWYEQPADPQDPWIAHPIGPSYRDVHEINLGQWNGGVPYVLVAEQEQACDPARPESKPPDHPGTPCRITMFQWNNGQPEEAVLADTGTQNQVVLPWRGGLLMADANHGAYGASRAVHLRLILPSVSNPVASALP